MFPPVLAPGFAPTVPGVFPPMEIPVKYITISSTQHRTKHYVAREAFGGNYYIIATCPTEDYAKLIAEAMNNLPTAVIRVIEKKAN